MINPEIGESGPDRPGAKVTLLGLPVDSTAMRFPEDLHHAKAQQAAYIVTFVNPNSCYIDKQVPDYGRLLRCFNRVYCDGIGMVMAARIRLGLRIPRQAFDTTSFAIPVFNWAASTGTPVILIGGKPGVADRAASILKEHFSGLQVLATYTGFGDDPAIAREFAVLHPQSLVVCGMGAPWQEEFLVSLAEAGWTGLGFTCGGFFDQVCERFAYYPAWVNHLNMRFLYRLMREPRRLSRRYFIDYGVFMRRMLFGTPAESGKTKRGSESMPG